MTDYDALGRTIFHYQRDGFNAIQTAPGQEVCDFCLAPKPLWEYPAGWMPVAGHAEITHSNDEWLACEECHRLIEAKDITTLVIRMVEEQSKKPLAPGYRLPPQEVRVESALMNVLGFMNARTGEARPFDSSRG